MNKPNGKIVAKGIVVQALPNTTFKVKLANGQEVPEHLRDQEVICHLAGKMRMYYIKVLPGDSVLVEMTPYDDQRGRIVYREK